MNQHEKCRLEFFHTLKNLCSTTGERRPTIKQFYQPMALN